MSILVLVMIPSIVTYASHLLDGTITNVNSGVGQGSVQKGLRQEWNRVWWRSFFCGTGWEVNVFKEIVTGHSLKHMSENELRKECNGQALKSKYKGI